jgi:glycosyltransferase involved in cell wall biosynthesis
MKPVDPEPEVTIVIPTHERPATLASTLDGVIKAFESGLNPDFEVVVADDASQDSTAETVESAAARTELPISHRPLETNRGSYAARNLGATGARGSLLLFIDDDMIVGPDHVSRHMTAHREEGPGTIVLGDRWEFAPEARARFAQGHFGSFRSEVEEWLKGQVTGGPVTATGRRETTTVDTCDMSISRETFQALGEFDEAFRWIGDQEYALRAREEGVKIVWDPQIKSLHNDPRLSFEQYCKRIERGSRAAPLLARRHPSTHDKGAMIEQNREIGPSDSARLRLKKRMKAFLTRPRVLRGLHAVANHSSWLPYGIARRLYWGVLGLHVFRGVRDGMGQEEASGAGAEEACAGQSRGLK